MPCIPRGRPQPPQESAAPRVTFHQDHLAYEELIRRQRPQRRRILSTGNDRPVISLPLRKRRRISCQSR